MAQAGLKFLHVVTQITDFMAQVFFRNKFAQIGFKDL